MKYTCYARKSVDDIQYFSIHVPAIVGSILISLITKAHFMKTRGYACLPHHNCCYISNGAKDNPIISATRSHQEIILRLDARLLWL